MSITPSIYTVISKSNPTGVYSRLPNSYINNLVYTPSVRPLNPVKGEQYYDSTDNILYFWNGNGWMSGGSSLPTGTSYGDYLYWNGTGGYIVGSEKINLGAHSGKYSQGNNSVAVGFYAGNTNQGVNSVSIGTNSGLNTQGNYSVSVGYNCGSNNQSDLSIAIGSNSASNFQGINSISIGSSAGTNNQGNNSISLGYNSANTNQGVNSVSIGTYSGNNQQGDYSIAIGRNAATSIQGVDSVSIGSFAGNTSQGNDSVAIGYYSGYNQQSDYSIAIGNGSGFDQQRSYSIAIGNGAGRETQQFSAIAIGDNAGYTNQQDNCIAIGSLAGNYNQGVTADPTNGQAIAIGYRAAENSQGDQAISIGTRAGNDNQHDYGIAIGNYAGSSSQSTGGIAIGVGAGSSLQGEYSIALGYNAGSSNQPSGSIIINASPTGLNASTGGLFINPIRGGSSSQVLFYNPSSKEITYSTGGNGYQGPQGPGGGFIQMVQLLDSVQAPTVSGQAIVSNWTVPFTSNGGKLMFNTSFSCFSTSLGLYTFDFLVDGNVVANTRFYFNNTSVHLTIPSLFNIENIAVGSHTGAIRIPSGITVDSGDYCNMSLIEVLGANSIGLTGPTGSNGPALFTLSLATPDLTLTSANSIKKIGPTGTASKATTVESYPYNSTFLTFRLNVHTSNDYSVGLSTNGTVYTYGFSFQAGTVYIYYNNVITSSGQSYTTNDIFTVVAQASGVYWYKNGVLISSNSLISGTSALRALINLYTQNDVIDQIAFGYSLQGLSNIGKDTQILFNYAGSPTGSNNLTYTGGNLILSTGNIGIGTTTPIAPLHVATSLTTLPTTSLIVNNYSGQNLSGNDYTISQLLMGTLSYYAGIQVRIPTGSYGDVTRLDFTTPAASNSNVQATRMSIMPTSGNVGIGTTNPTYLLHVNGNISPYTVNRGNPGRNNTLLLDSFNTTHFYSINASTGFIDISTTMLENAVYEVCFNLSSSSSANNDMTFYPNSTTTFGGSTFYTAYQQTSSVPALQYTTNVGPYFMFDMVNGSVGWDPVGKITIYNNRSCKKIVFTGGDTTAPVNGQGYWTNNTGFTSTSGTAPVYDTTTVWSTVGRLQFGSPLFSNWNVWVKRIM